MIKLKKDGGEIPLELRQYPAGEQYVRILDHSPNFASSYDITLKWASPSSLITLTMLVDAIRRNYGEVDISLHLPYMPYSRHDRVINKGEAHALKVFCTFINQMNFYEVTTLDPHSLVCEALIDRLKELPTEPYLDQIPLNTTDMLLVAPDLGAIKRTAQVADYLGAKGVLQGYKHRDVKTGEIKAINCEVNCNIPPETPLLIVDDICDGGGTFKGLAEALRAYYTGDLYLYVTHGIFSKGLDVLKGSYTKVFTINTDSEADNFLTILEKR